LFNQVALKDGKDDDEIDNLNSLRGEYVRNPFGHTMRICKRVSLLIEKKVNDMVREGPHKGIDFSTRDIIDQFAVRPSEIRGLTAGCVIDSEYSIVAGKIHGLNHR
jgi:hypothetical protein